MINREKIENIFLNSLNILRSDIYAPSSNEYILQLCFLKLLCDIERPHQAIRNNIILGMNFFEKEILFKGIWSTLRNAKKEVSQIITVTFKEIEKENAILKGVLINPQSNQWERINYLTLEKLIQNFSDISFDSLDFDQTKLIVDIFHKFIIAQGLYNPKTNVNYLTPPSSIKELMVKLANPQPKLKICDPSCGFGGILIECIRYFYENKFYFQELSISGQAMYYDLRAITVLSLILYGVESPNISSENIIYKPLLNQYKEVEKFNLVITNPPFGVREWLKSNQEFKYGLPPNNSADYAFIQRILQILEPKGKAVIIIPHGVLFRGGIEGKIRQNIIHDDLIEAIIGLPQRLFYTTTIPTAIIIFNLDKQENRRKKILFIDASHECVKEQKQNILTTPNIEHIYQTYFYFREKSGYSAIVPYEAIEKNDYILDVNYYVQPIEQENIVDVNSQIQNLKELELKKQKISEKIDECLKKLNFKI